MPQLDTMPWDPEWDDWYKLTPQERWVESMKLLELFYALGGSDDPDFNFADAQHTPGAKPAVPAYGGTSVRVVRRSAI